MIKTLQILLIFISLNSFGQNFNYLKEVEMRNLGDCQNHKSDLLKSADYILSIPIDFETNNREIISNFLLKWTGVALNGFQISNEIAETIEIDQNLMIVYLACIVKSTSSDFNKLKNFNSIEDQVIENYIDYCKNYEFLNKEIFQIINEANIKTNSNPRQFNIPEAPNKIDNNGLKQGLWKEQFPDEKFEYAIISYVNDIKQGEFSAFLKDNVLYMIGNYKNGKLHGTHIIYYPNGQIKIKRNFVDGLESGTKYTYNEDGSLYSVVNYKDGELHGSYFKYDSEGDLKWYVEYKNGEQISTTKIK